MEAIFFTMAPLKSHQPPLPDNTDSDPEADVVGDNDVDIDCDADVDMECDIDVEADTDVNAETDVDGDTDVEADTEVDAEAEVVGDNDVDIDCEIDVDLECDIAVEADTEIDAEADVNCDIGIEADAELEIKCDEEAEATRVLTMRILESFTPTTYILIILTDFRQSYDLRLGGVYPREFSLTPHGPDAFLKIRKAYCHRLLLCVTRLTTACPESSVSLIKFLSITSHVNIAYVFCFQGQFYGFIFCHKVAISQRL